MEETKRMRDFYEPQLFHDHFQNFKSYNIPRAQLVIADVPYNLGKNAYASNPAWYKDGDNKNGESELAGKMFFESDGDFSPAHFMIFCERLLRREGKDEKGEAIGATGKKKSTAPCKFSKPTVGVLMGVHDRYNFIGLKLEEGVSRDAIKDELYKRLCERFPLTDMDVQNCPVK